ncbi:MAG: hypothetical protein M3331_03510 [Actinomycetota bacterium]|nr:hypothetical protein [Actinomycetota bacterium]
MPWPKEVGHMGADARVRPGLRKPRRLDERGHAPLGFEAVALVFLLGLEQFSKARSSGLAVVSAQDVLDLMRLDSLPKHRLVERLLEFGLGRARCQIQEGPGRSCDRDVVDISHIRRSQAGCLVDGYTRPACGCTRDQPRDEGDRDVRA